MKFSTKAIHAGHEPDPSSGAIATPIHMTSTFAQDEPGVHRGYTYSRVANPTRDVLEKNLASLEEGSTGIAFGSGVAAIDALLRVLKPNDHIVLSRDIYGGTYRIVKMVWEDHGLDANFVDASDIAALRAAIRPSTRMLFLETPTNPTMRITDLEAVASVARERNIISVVDSTFATPYLQQPLRYGITAVMHSLTKYLNGHSDMIGGIVITSDQKLADQLRFLQKSTGAILSPFEAWLCERGTKTLALRMRQHCENAMMIAEWLQARPEILHIHYPGLPSHPHHELAGRQMRAFGGVVSFDLGSMATATTFLKRLCLCTLAESLGGVETLISHPATMSHASLPREQRDLLGIPDGLLRLSVGIEDAEDIIADLDQAFTGLRTVP